MTPVFRCRRNTDKESLCRSLSQLFRFLGISVNTANHLPKHGMDRTESDWSFSGLVVNWHGFSEYSASCFSAQRFFGSATIAWVYILRIRIHTFILFNPVPSGVLKSFVDTSNSAWRLTMLFSFCLGWRFSVYFIIPDFWAVGFCITKYVSSGYISPLANGGQNSFVEQIGYEWSEVVH